MLSFPPESRSMNSFLGWLHVDATRPNADLHAQMAATTSAEWRVLLDSPPAGVSVALPLGDALASGDIAVLVCGAPRWRDAELAGLARERGQAAALRAAYERAGERLVEVMGGAFALAIVDRAQRRVLAAVDPLGIEPLCYAQTEHGLVFGRSVSLVAAHPHVDAALDLQSIYDYLYFHAVPSPQTIVRGVRKLEPGQLLDQRDGRLTLTTYWQPEFAARAPATEQACAAELRALLEQAVREQASTAERTGAFLSGVDSSTVAGMLARAGQKPARTFTIGFAADGYDEVSYARTSARHFGTQAEEYYLSAEDVAAAIPKIAAHYDEPFGNSSAVPVYCCARLARERGVSRMLAGDGGDELFGGNSRYAKMNVFEWYQRAPSPLRALARVAFSRGDSERGLWPLRKARSYVQQAMVPMPDRLQSYNHFSRSLAADILHPELLANIDLGRPLAQLRATYATPRDADVIDRMLFLDWKFTLADNDLRKVGGMCELAGVEVRYPWLDDRLVDFSTRLPARWKVRGQQLRWFVKRALTGFLPDEVIHKPKHGFGLPFGVWMATHPGLKELAGDSLASLRRRALLRADYIDELQRRHREEHAHYYGEFIWVLVMLEQWLTQREARAAAMPRQLRAVGA
jgi:asparagine synthase (glutamine-hydrolysing)